MDILLISNEDACRSRIAQELLHTFGRGMNISTAGVMEGNCVPDVVCNVMEQNGYGISRKKAFRCRSICASVMGLCCYPV